jgi:hypothetical protein
VVPGLWHEFLPGTPAGVTSGSGRSRTGTAPRARFHPAQLAGSCRESMPQPGSVASTSGKIQVLRNVDNAMVSPKAW